MSSCRATNAKAYRDAADCRRMAASLIAAADWLDLPGETADEDDA